MNMEIVSLFLIAIALAMDAFSVSLTEGFRLRKNISIYQTLIIGLFFGIFQAIMPLLGWIAGEQISSIVSTFAPIIAFILLVAIGVKMIYDSVREIEGKEDENSEFSHKKLLILAIATSIDAFAIGVSFSLLGFNNIIIPMVVIGVVAFIFSELGVFLGEKLGNKFGDKFEVFGGIILILLGIKILIGI
ncbi:manganese efflux pump MntP family protein [Methanobrevibacter sp. DSM 116169]|uniref:manganese efflux pump MntP n=1 Tax=Methanobrevibacter sp. DSM 116169 TaxID=3242727 RepID=UPI0038FBE6D3